MVNALTIDVEDYFHVSAFESCIRREDWNSMPVRVDRNTVRVLDMLDEYGLKATFFVLGWVAMRYPYLVRIMAARGHEVGCHGYNHRRITTMSRQEFAQDIDRSRKLLQDISGQPVHGYRAPSYTITKRTMWALDALIEAGFNYDSSIFPIHHDIYGMPGAKRFLHHQERNNGSIPEFPPTTLGISLLGKKLNIPVAGGGYLRLMPARWISSIYSRLNRQGNSCMLYFHPWEIDPEQPRVKAPLKSRLRHYLNLKGTENKLKYLFGRHSFAPMHQVIEENMRHA